MTRRPFALTASLVMTALLACGERQPDPAAPPDRRALALAASAGTAEVDRELAAARARAQMPGAPAQSWVLLASAWVRKGRTTGDPGFLLSAEAAADVALELAPRFGPALGVKALALLGRHRFRPAAALASRVLADDPGDLVALGALADAQLELGDVAGAAQASQAMLDIKPSLPAYARASYLRWLQGDLAGARELIRLAIDSARGARDREPGAWALVQAAMLFWHAGDLDGADHGFGQALERVPDYPPALIGKGRVAVARGDGGQAARWLERAVQISPSVEALGLLVDARELTGDGDGAARAVGQLLREGRRTDRLGLATFLATRGRDTVQALALLDEERRERSGLYLEDAHAWALYRAGRFSEARAASDRARIGTPDARLLFHAGAIRVAQGQLSEGRALIRAALTLNPHFDRTGAREARSLLPEGTR